MSETWKPFYFDGNQSFGDMNSPEDWRQVIKAYRAAGKNITFHRSARLNPGSEKRYGKASFGFYREFVGPLTLCEWADAHGIKLDL